MITTRHILTLAACFPLAACRSGYDVDVRNMTDQPVVASLAVAHEDGSARLLAMQRLGPGDRGALGQQTDANQRVWLEVDFAGNTGHPARMDLIRGRTIVNVRRADAGSKGKLALEEVPRP